MHEKTNNLHRRKQSRRSAFATWIVQFLSYLNPKFQASNHLLWLYRPVCVRPGQKPKLLVFSRTGSFTTIKRVLDVTSQKHVRVIYTPLEPHFYIVKLGYPGVYLFFLFLLQNIDCGYSLEPPRRGGSNVYPQSMFWSKNMKNMYTPAYLSFTI